MVSTKTQWILELIDKISSPLNQIAIKSNVTQQSLGALDSEIDRLSQSGDTLKRSLGKITLFGGGVALAASKIISYNEELQGYQTTTKNLFEQNINGLQRSQVAMDEISASALAIQDTFGTDYQDNLIGVNALAKAYKLEIGDALQITKDGFIDGANATGEYLDFLKEYPVQLKDIGLNARQAVSFMSFQIKEGVMSDKGLDLLKEANLSLKEMPKGAIDAIEGLGLSSSKIQEGIQKGTLTTFGAIQMISKAMETATVQARQTAIADIFKGAGEDAGAEFILTLKDANLQLDNMSNKSDPIVNGLKTRLTLNEQIRQKQLQLNNSITPFSNELQNSILQTKLGVFTLVASVASMINSFTESNPILSKFIGYVALASTGLVIGGTVLGLVSIQAQIYSLRLQKAALSKNLFARATAKASLAMIGFTKNLFLSGLNLLKNIGLYALGATTLIGGFITALISATAAQLGLNVVMMANPIGLFVIGLTAVGVATYALIKNFDAVKRFLIDMGAFLLKNNPFMFIINLLDTIFPNFKASLVEVFKSVLEYLTVIWDKIKGVFSTIGKFLGLVNDTDVNINTQLETALIPNTIQTNVTSGVNDNSISDFLRGSKRNDTNLNPNKINQTNSKTPKGFGNNGSSASKTVNMTLNINQTFYVDDDLSSKIDEIADRTVGKINDRLRDSIIQLD